MNVNLHKKPDWLKISVPGGKNYTELRKLLKNKCLSTVCEEARCPNISECWERRIATFMILGSTCTRGCRFCNVKTGNPKGKIDTDEPRHVADSVKQMGLNYAVITSVDRDDLYDEGAKQFAITINEIRRQNKNVYIEVLIPDFSGKDELIQKVIDSKPHVIGHNIETVERLTLSVRDKRCKYSTSLKTLRMIKEKDNSILTKSSIMLGLGETIDDIYSSINDLSDCSVDILTLGQYLQPSKQHLPVSKYYKPVEFDMIKCYAESKGFLFVVAGPLVRSSYKANEIVKYLDKNK